MVAMWGGIGAADIPKNVRYFHAASSFWPCYIGQRLLVAPDWVDDAMLCAGV